MEKFNRDFRMQGFTRTASHDMVDFNLCNYGQEMRVHGLILFGVSKDAQIQSIQLGNYYLVMDAIPAGIFAKADVKTFEDAQRELERGGFALMRRQEMQGILGIGGRAVMRISGECEGAALYCEYIAMPNIQPRRVAVTRSADQWRGELFEDTLLGEARVLDITAATEDAVMQGVIAGLGGIRVRVG